MDDRSWRCEITTGARWGWYLSFTHGLCEVEGTPFWRPTRKSAERAARKFIARREQEERKQRDLSFTIENDGER